MVTSVAAGCHFAPALPRCRNGIISPEVPDARPATAAEPTMNVRFARSSAFFSKTVLFKTICSWLNPPDPGRGVTDAGRHMHGPRIALIGAASGR